RCVRNFVRNFVRIATCPCLRGTDGTGRRRGRGRTYCGAHWLLTGKEATVEPWEDTDFRLYKVIDRFGFLQRSYRPYDQWEE
ncbi:hypothetical protein CRUP_028238, partial [Coryphaenoides rupestris]